MKAMGRRTMVATWNSKRRNRYCLLVSRRLGSACALRNRWMLLNGLLHLADGIHRLSRCLRSSGQGLWACGMSARYGRPDLCMIKLPCWTLMTNRHCARPSEHMTRPHLSARR